MPRKAGQQATGHKEAGQQAIGTRKSQKKVTGHKEAGQQAIGTRKSQKKTMKKDGLRKLTSRGRRKSQKKTTKKDGLRKPTSRGLRKVTTKLQETTDHGRTLMKTEAERLAKVSNSH